MTQIAVLIPSYKPGSYLKDCLEALDKQTLPAAEYKIYLGLNGPRDPYQAQTEAILQRLHCRSKLICFDRAGVSHARNGLIEFSSEPYITFVDDDDIVSENYLEQLLAVSTERIMGIANSRDFLDDPARSQDNFVGRCFERLPARESSLYRSRQYYSAPWAKLLHRSLIGPVRFDTRLARGEDALFMAQLAPRVECSAKTSADAVYWVRQRPNSASRRKVGGAEESRRIFYLLRRYLRLLCKRDSDTAFVASRIVATLLQFRNLLP